MEKERLLLEMEEFETSELSEAGLRADLFDTECLQRSDGWEWGAQMWQRAELFNPSSVQAVWWPRCRS